MLKARTDVKNVDEIELIALVQGLWAQKLIIVIAAVIGVTLAYAYANFSIVTPMYEAKVYVLPPAQGEIAGFNIGRSNSDAALKPFTVAEVYALFVKKLQGEALRQEFFKKVYLPSLSENSRKGSGEHLSNDFARQLVVGSDKGSPDRYFVAAQSQDSKQAAAWVQQYVERASDLAKAELIFNITQEASLRASDLKERISNLRESALLAREDRISRLREALSIAGAIGLVSPAPSNALVTLSGVMDESLAYRRGTKALAAEIDVLQSRTSDDAFVPDLRKLQASYDRLTKLSIPVEDVSVSRQDGGVDASNIPLKTKKNIIILAGLVAGMVLGVFLALIRIFLPRSLSATE